MRGAGRLRWHALQGDVTEDSFLAMAWLEVAEHVLEHVEASWLLTLTALWPNRDNATL